MDELERLRLAMEAAAEVEDFELARTLRDRIALIRGGASPAEAAAADTMGIARQRPGAMGLGTSQQRVTPPEGWRPPAKPDPMTQGQSRAKRDGKRTGKNG